MAWMPRRSWTSFARGNSRDWHWHHQYASSWKFYVALWDRVETWYVDITYNRSTNSFWPVWTPPGIANVLSPGRISCTRPQSSGTSSATTAETLLCHGSPSSVAYCVTKNGGIAIVGWESRSPGPWWCCCEGTNPSFAWIAWRARTAQLLVVNFKLKWYPSECRNMLENLAKRPKMQRNLQLNRHSRRRDQPKEWWIDRFIHIISLYIMFSIIFYSMIRTYVNDVFFQ